MNTIEETNNVNELDFNKKWEQSVHRQQAKGLDRLKSEVAHDTDELHSIVARGILRICLIGKKLEAVKRLAGHGNAMAAWEELGYSQASATRYITASQFEPVLREIQSKREDPIGIAEAYKSAVAAKRHVAEQVAFDPNVFAEMEDKDFIESLAKAAEDAPKPRAAKKRGTLNGTEAIIKNAANLIGQMELNLHDGEIVGLIGQINDWSTKILNDIEGGAA